MAITQRYALNAAVQYNEVDMTDYLVNDGTTGKKFLTGAPLQRLLRATESAALYFATNDTSFDAAALYRFYDANGDLLLEYALDLTGAEPNSAIPVNMDMFEQPADTARLTVTIVQGAGNLLANPDFELGSGDTFTSWTKVITSATNELVYSQELSNAIDWIANFPVLANDTTAPDGTATADKIVEQNCLGCYSFILQDVNESNAEWCFSVYMKADERDIAFMTLQDASGINYYTWFDLANGLVLTNNNTSAGIESAGNGWYRCHISRNIDMSGGFAAVFFGPTDADGVDLYDCIDGFGLHAWGAQLELGDTPTSYKATTGSAVTADEGSIVQATRTNLLLRSQEFDNASWGKNGAGTGIPPVVTANNSIAPDGTITADKIVFNCGAGLAPSDQSTIFQTYTINNKLYVGSVYLKGSIGGEVILLRHSYGSDFSEYTLTTEWQRFENKRINTAGFIEFGVRQGVPNIINSNITIFAWGAQLEEKIDYASAYIPTTSSAVTIADGRNGSRAPRFNRLTRDVALYQSVTTIGVQYRLQFWAKYYEGFPEIAITDGSVVYESIPLTNEDYQLFEVYFTATSGQVHIVCASGTDSAIAVDDVLLSEVNPTELTETRTYLYDTTCSANEVELNWLNKLGGRDSWVFTGYPIEERNVNRITPIEYARVSNLTAPNRVYANRQNVSRKGYTVTHRCGDRATAVWLKEELMDSIDVMMKVGTEYYPVQVTNASMVTNDSFSQDYTVRFNILQAYDINIQTR